jgi:hypothetical protein
MPLMSTLYSQRIAFEKQLLAEIGTHLKRSEWKKSSCALFRQSDGIYQDIFIAVHRNSASTTTELRLKPMALDPILWDILDIPENRDMPLSFRTWGAFTCSAIPVYEAQIESFGDTAGDVAHRLIALYKDKISLVDHVLSEKPFSELVSSHPNQIERGAYAVTLVTSLINDGNLDLAYGAAMSYASGALSSCVNLVSSGKSFHQLAVEWMDAGRYSKLALHAAAGA